MSDYFTPSIDCVYRRTSSREGGRLKLPCSSLDLGAVTTAPPKPSVQTQFVLSRMDELERKVDEHWEHVLESMDLIFSRIGEVRVSSRSPRSRLICQHR